MPTDLQTILKLSVPVIVQVGRRRMPLQDVLALAPGAILELEKPAGEDLDLRVNNKVIGKGVAVKIGENFGVRITGIQTQRQRVEAMGKT